LYVYAFLLYSLVQQESMALLLYGSGWAGSSHSWYVTTHDLYSHMTCIEYQVGNKSCAVKYLECELPAHTHDLFPTWYSTSPRQIALTILQICVVTSSTIELRVWYFTIHTEFSIPKRLELYEWLKLLESLDQWPLRRYVWYHLRHPDSFLHTRSNIPIFFYTHKATSRYFSTHTKLQLCDRLELLELQVKWHGPHSRCMWYHLWKTGGRFRFGNDEKSAARVSSCIFAYLFMCQCICRTGECVDVLLCINWFTLVYSQWVFWVQPVLEDETRNAEFNGNRSPECWENCGQLQIRITQKSQFEFVPRDTSEFKSNQNLNSTLYREIPRYLIFSMLTCWLKSPQHSGFRLPLNSAFRVSSSTERAVSIDLLWCIRSTDERWGAGVEYHFQEI